MRSANYKVVRAIPGEPLLIQDIGPWDQFPTVTNDVEGVVAQLTQLGLLDDDRRLFYYDSEAQLAEIRHKGGQFRGFRPIEPSVTVSGADLDGGQ